MSDTKQDNTKKNENKKNHQQGNQKPANLIHWSDFTADRIIRQRGDKEVYTVASGITPSGVVHFGNFREVITVDLVARALRARGKKVRFIFSWDDYDTFRKIPPNMPKQEELQKYMFQPIVDTPDPFEREESYARHHETNFESQLSKVGVEVEPLYQAKKYRAGEYKDQIKKTLVEKAAIVDILNEYRKEPLADSWQPVSIYCEKCNTDKMKLIEFDGEDTLSYECDTCNHKGSETLSTTSRVKLPWRMDWPMRWVFEDVDFEPGGKDHSSQGGSYTTAKDIVDKVYGGKPPVYLQYDFVSIKGAGGKMSSSSGNVITVNDVLKVYEPEMVRWIFASYKTNIDFSVSFDLDVIKVYEDYDKQERLAFGVDTGNEKKVNMAKRVFQLCQIDEMPKEAPFQPSFRHLTNLLQINDNDIERARPAYADQIKNDRDERRFRERAACAIHWLENYAPDDFKFTVNTAKPAFELSDLQKTFVANFAAFLKDNWESMTTDKELHEKMYEQIHAVEITPADAFLALYELLISCPKGPKLAGFIRTIGKDRVLNILS